MEITKLNRSYSYKSKERVKKMIEPNQNITKAYAVAYCVLAYNTILTRVAKKERTPERIGHEMIACMRKYKPKKALLLANKILNK